MTINQADHIGDNRQGKATVKYDNATADLNQLTSATTKAGYPSTPKG
jgi:periplasmic mercuric ion binding protein